ARALELLARRAGEVVTRDELRRHLWGDETFVDFDRGLNFCVAAIRAALGDDARSPRFVETLPRRGYRFIADVRVVSAGQVPVAAAARAAAGEGRTQAAGRRWSAAAALAASLLGLAQGAGLPRAHTRDTARQEARSAFERALASQDPDDAARRRRIATL